MMIRKVWHLTKEMTLQCEGISKLGLHSAHPTHSFKTCFTCVLCVRTMDMTGEKCHGNIIIHKDLFQNTGDETHSTRPTRGQLLELIWLKTVNCLGNDVTFKIAKNISWTIRLSLFHWIPPERFHHIYQRTCIDIGCLWWVSHHKWNLNVSITMCRSPHSSTHNSSLARSLNKMIWLSFLRCPVFVTWIYVTRISSMLRVLR